ncbi:MAG TPA: hypothetical protein VGK88_14230 [bacterium]|jgi:hypothetical protein
MTSVEWLIVGIVFLRLACVRRAAGGLVAEAIADATLALPVFLLQEARWFHAGAWTVFTGGVPPFVVVYGVALLGTAVSVAERIGEVLERRLSSGLSPWLTAAIDVAVLAALTAVGETILFHAGGWEYRFRGPLGTIPSAGVPWAAVVGAGGFGLFFVMTIRQFRRWATDAVGRLAVRGRAVLGLDRAAPDAVLAGGAAVGLGLRRTLGAAVFRLLDL